MVADSARVTMGVDPGIATTGYAILVGHKLRATGRITTSAKLAEPVRYAELMEELIDTLRAYEVTDVAVEKFYAFYVSDDAADSVQARVGITSEGGGLIRRKRKSTHEGPSNPRSLYLMKGAQTVVLLAAMTCGAAVAEYTLDEWKGNARLNKAQIRDQANRIYGVSIRNNNVTDALMIAHHHAHRGHLLRGKLIRRRIAIPDVAHPLDASASNR